MHNNKNHKQYYPNSTMNYYTSFQLIEINIFCQVLLTVGYLISAIILSGNSYNGFNAIITSFLYFLFSSFCFYGLQKNVINRTIFGIILGISCMMIFISLESAMFWWAYSYCNSYKKEIQPNSSNKSRSLLGIECDHVGAMTVISFLSFLLLLSNITLSYTLVKYKDDILIPAPINEGYYAVAVEENGKTKIASNLPANVK